MGYYKIDERIHAIPQKTLTWAQKLFYSRLTFRCNHKNLSWWSKKKLAADFQTTARNIQRWWWRLEKLGLITIHQEVGSEHEVSINELTEDLLKRLGVPQMSREGRHGCLGRGDVGVSPSRKGKDKTKKKTGGAATGRESFNETFEHPEVQASGRRAVEAAENAGRHAILSPEAEGSLAADMWPPETASAEPDEATLAGWSKKVWAKHFVARMELAGYDTAFRKYTTTVPTHVGAIRDHLLNRGFSRLKIYRFLLEWFPATYRSFCGRVFKKRADDLMFSVSWMEPRLDELVRLYEDRDVSSSLDDKITFTD